MLMKYISPMFSGYQILLLLMTSSTFLPLASDFSYCDFNPMPTFASVIYTQQSTLQPLHMTHAPVASSCDNKIVPCNLGRIMTTIPMRTRSDYFYRWNSMEVFNTMLPLTVLLLYTTCLRFCKSRAYRVYRLCPGTPGTFKCC